MSMTRATAAGACAMNSGVNKRGGTMSLIAASPPERTSATRSSQACRDGIGVVAVQQTTSDEIRSGARAASQMPIMPPRETPQYAADVMPCSPSRPSTSAASPAIEYGPGGAGERAPGSPCPRSSYLSRRNRLLSTAAWASQTALVAPRGLPSTTTGAPSGPSSRAASRTVPPAGGSDIEEDGLAVALQRDVEPEVPLGLGHGDQRRPPGRLRDRAQHRVRRVGRLLIGEVHPGHQPVEQPAREHGHVEVRCLDAAVRGGQRPGLERDDAVRPVGGGRAPAEAAEGVVAGRG